MTLQEKPEAEAKNILVLPHLWVEEFTNFYKIADFTSIDEKSKSLKNKKVKKFQTQRKKSKSCKSCPSVFIAIRRNVWPSSLLVGHE